MATTAYPNLAAEMAREEVTPDDLAKLTGKTSMTIRNWLKGSEGNFPIRYCIAIKDEFFPELSIEYLFEPKKG